MQLVLRGSYKKISVVAFYVSVFVPSYTHPMDKNGEGPSRNLTHLSTGVEEPDGLVTVCQRLILYVTGVM